MTRFNLIIRAGACCALSSTLLVAGPAHGGGLQPNYAEALQKSLFFYEAQRSGPLPQDNRVTWRASSGLEDGKAEGVDLTGGWHDAGDHVKFGLPAAATTTLLAMSLLEDAATYEQTGQKRFALANLKWETDWLLKAHTAPNEFWGQVGNGGLDHAFWGAPETMTMARPAAKIDASCPGSDLAGEGAAALAAASLVFRSKNYGDPAYGEALLRHARELYRFADEHRGSYSDCIRDAQAYYRSMGYKDELVWGALWLHLATGDAGYLAKAEGLFDELRGSDGQMPFKWTHSWDDKTYGSYVLLARITGKARYHEAAQRWLDYWTVGANGERITYTPGGLAWLDTWGSLRYSANTAFFAMVYADTLAGSGGPLKLVERYRDFAKAQIDYALGNNPGQQSFVVGYGAKSPRNPHHRSAHGSWANNIEIPTESRHILYGALVGGPDQNDRYEDRRSDYMRNEVAIDYNAAFTGALAHLAKQHPGAVDPNFPATETKSGELSVSAKINATGTDFFEWALRLQNHTAWPARQARNVKVRYFFSLAATGAPEQAARELLVQSNYSEGAKVTGIFPWDSRNGIYFAEMDFSNARSAPIGESESRREIQVRLSLPRNGRGWAWDWSKDWSAAGLGSGDYTLAPRITVYENGALAWGAEPPRALDRHSSAENN